MEGCGRFVSETGIEENTLAILDSDGIKDVEDDIDDRLAFLEAVRAASIVPDAGVAPTGKMCEATFGILREVKSLELCMASFQLLVDINKRFPSIITPNASSTTTEAEVAVVKEAWSPIVVGADIPARTKDTKGKNCSGPFDSSGFHQLIKCLMEEADLSNVGLKALGYMLLFQYIVDVLETDFLTRCSSYKDTTNWTFVRDSLLNSLLSSRRISFKNLIKDCITLISILQKFSSDDGHGVTGSKHLSSEQLNLCDAAVSMALLEREKQTCLSVRKLLVMIMELGLLKKAADMQFQTTRSDGVRFPTMEIILDELTYNTDVLFQFLKVFDEPKWKLELVLQYLRKYIAKPNVRTRRSNDTSTDDGSLVGILNTLSNLVTAKTVIRKIRSTEVLQWLLAHAFQAYISLSSEKPPSGSVESSSEILQGSSKEEVCKGVIAAFRSLKTADETVGILAIGTEALFIASMMLSEMRRQTL